eukprot:6473616-Amphidinium_carterae.1
MDALQTFAASGYTRAAADGSWRLTELALSRICTGTAYQFSSDLYALNADVGTKAVQDCSNYEVMKLLHLAGWKRQGMPPRARRRQVQPFLRGGVLQKKVYYGTFHRKYAEHGILNIRHFLAETDYDLLLRGTHVACADHDDDHDDGDDADFLQDDLATHVTQDNWEDEHVNAATEPHPQPELPDPNTPDFEHPFAEMSLQDDDEFLRSLEEALENFVTEEAYSDVSDSYDDFPPLALVSGACETELAVHNMEQPGNDLPLQPEEIEVQVEDLAPLQPEEIEVHVEDLAPGFIEPHHVVHPQDDVHALEGDTDARYRSGNVPLPAEIAVARQTLEDAVVETLQLTVVPRQNSRVLKWGAFVITHKPWSSTWQIACPWHARSTVTGCRKSVTCRATHESVNAHVNSVKMLILWARAARDYDKQRWHLLHPLPAPNELPSTDILLTYKADMSVEPEPGTVVDDETMERSGDPTAAAKPRAKTKAKAKGKAEGKGKHKPGAKAKGRAAGGGKGKGNARKGKASGKVGRASSASSSSRSNSSSCSSASSSSSS